VSNPITASFIRPLPVSHVPKLGHPDLKVELHADWTQMPVSMAASDQVTFVRGRGLGEAK